MIDSATLAPLDTPVRGLWRCINLAPGRSWWLQPADEHARHWLRVHGPQVGAQSDMINVHTLRLVPSWLQLPVPGT